MALENRPRDVRRIAAITLAGLLLFAAGTAVGMWVQRDGNDSGIHLSTTDIGFAQDMSMHHEQAVLLSQTLARDVEPRVRALADQIVVAQNAEIATMHGWLMLVGAPYTAAEPMAWVQAQEHDHHGGDGPPMPGMASTDDIVRLSGLHGNEAEVLFLQLMIRHHRGGVDMAEAAYNQGLYEPIERVALGMIRDQGNEIGMMTAMLAARQEKPLPYP